MKHSTNMALRQTQYEYLEEVWDIHLQKLNDKPEEDRRIILLMMLRFHDLMCTLIEHGYFDPPEVPSKKAA